MLLQFPAKERKIVERFLDANEIVFDATICNYQKFPNNQMFKTNSSYLAYKWLQFLVKGMANPNAIAVPCQGKEDS